MSLSKYDLDRLRTTISEALKVMIGDFEVWNLQLRSVTPKDKKYMVQGGFSEEYGGEKPRSFKATIDDSMRIESIEILPLGTPSQQNA